jgi:hypothetical protein
VSTPITTPDRLPARGTGIVDDLATGLPDWERMEPPDWDPAWTAGWDTAEPTDWDSAEPTDWDPAELADRGPGDPEGELLELAGPDPEASEPEAERRSLGRAEGGSREALKAGPWGQAHGDGGWFATGGVADDLLPGPRLAGFIADAGAVGLGRLTDDELIGVMRAARRLASWSASMELAAGGDLWRRRWAEAQDGDTRAALHTDDEIAAALTLTRRAADQALSLAIALRRLPLTSRALAAGDIDLPRAMVIADEVTGVSNEHAAAVEQAIIDAATNQTTGQLRAATRRAVLAADPRAARKRKERALQDARVERWDEHGGTAALAGRDLPPASVLAADKNLSALARQLKGAGAHGTLDQLRAQVYLALLTGTPMGSLIPAGPGSDSGMSPGDSPRGFPGLTGDSTVSTTSAGFSPPAGPSAFGSLGVPTGTVNLTMPLASWLGLSDAPGNVAGYGPLDADDSRAIADVLSARSGTRWCLTLTDSHGRPVAHGCARAGPPSAQGTGSRAGPAGSPGDRPADSPRDGPRTGATSEPEARAPDKTWTFSLTFLTGGDCDHARETAAYRPSAGLRHLIEIRHATCTYPGCRLPATRCDADHTVAYHRGGRTCLCNLAPLCRRHHAAKQASGWFLEQATPGVMTWTTPTGRRYAVGPSDYPD